MTPASLELSPRACSRVAGLAYLTIIAAGIFAEFFVRSQLIVPGDAAATAANIRGAEPLFRAGLAGDLVMLLCDVVVGLALYLLLRPVSQGLALLAAFLRLVHAAVYGAGLLNLFFVLMLVSGSGSLGAFAAPQLHALVLLFLEAHGYGYVIGLVFFGLHCLVLGYMVLRSARFPRVLGALLIAASCGYLTDSFAQVLLPDYADYEPVLLTVVFVPALVAELSLGLWLTFRGVREA